MVVVVEEEEVHTEYPACTQKVKVLLKWVSWKHTVAAKTERRGLVDVEVGSSIVDSVTLAEGHCNSHRPLEREEGYNNGDFAENESHECLQACLE